MYSFNLGPVHFIGFSTEVYYFLNYGLKTLVSQYEWLEQDLIEANKPENRQVFNFLISILGSSLNPIPFSISMTLFNLIQFDFLLHRKLRPWIVTYGHRPMYCSNDNGDDCAHLETLVRVGLPFTHWFGLEPLFYKYGVDVEIWAHEHSYERLWPIYDYKVKNGSYKEPYTNPGAPVHVVTGSAGCKEGREPFFKVIPTWSAFHSQVCTTFFPITFLAVFTYPFFRVCSDFLIDFYPNPIGLWLHANEGLQ